MRIARIYRLTRSAMQAGAKHPAEWRIEWEVAPDGHRWANPVMGWASSGDAVQAMQLRFPSSESAIQFAKRQVMSLRGISEPRKFSVEEWKKRCEQVGLSREVFCSDLNAMVLNFLMVEGYQDAAAKFIAEARLTTPSGFEQMQERMIIQEAIHRGDVISAIEKINELDSELLDTHPAVHFMLLRLELIERMRAMMCSPNADVTPILEFAAVHLAPRAHTNTAFLEELESAMALLCFSSDNIAPALKPLLDLSLRRTVASHVNAAILESQGLIQESKIKTLLRLWGWSQKKLRQNADFPAFDFTATN
ncbi:hypothetical protein PORY_001065 [Pneumocystis oryctolagi]|uniref:Uncharacterized protein n=1 Tax=Pneumocystis oryctolagi TaxID=42067 RepID=A0ACB7CIG4_9ASCO|nr:hypothetical protein PORY_001065 [Pneumocystis oryctolagi]